MATVKMPFLKCPLKFVLLLLITLLAGVGANPITLQDGIGGPLSIDVSKVTPTADNKVEDFSETAAIAGLLLAIDTPAYLYGMDSSADVSKMCTQFSNTGAMSFNASLSAAGGDHSMIMQVSWK
jgi:hypothetical protein